MADRIIQTETLQSIANALRGGSSQSDDDKIQVSDFAETAAELKTAEQDFINILERDTVEITIPEGTTKIANLEEAGVYATAFTKNQNLKKVIMPNTITELGNGLFSGCINLEEVVLSENSNVIPIAAFFNCKKLTNINIPNSVTRIKDDAFEGCELLRNLTIPSNATVSGGYIFNGCTALETVNIPKAETIGEHCFRNCINLSQIILPEGTEEIEYEAFYGCTNLSTISLPSTIKSIGLNAFNNIKSDAVINCAFSEGAVNGAPWGAPETVTINYDVNN